MADCLPEVLMVEIVSAARIAVGLTELWSPRVVAELGDSYVKVAKVQGSLAWHRHEREGELVCVLKVTARRRSISEQLCPV